MLHRFLLLLFLVFQVFYIPVVWGNDPKSEAELEANIKNIQQKLKILKTKLNKAYGEEQSLLEKLELQDKQISQIANNIDQSTQLIDQITQQISDVENKIQENTNSIENQKNHILKLLKLTVYIHHDKTLKMVLGTTQNVKKNQGLHQIKYLQNKLYKLIEGVADEIKVMQVLKGEQLALQEAENLNQQKLLKQQDSLLEQRNLRLVTLGELKKEIAIHQNQSEGLNKDQKRLQQLLSQIQVLLSDLPKDLGKNKPFVQLKGKIKKPVLGKYIRSYKSKRSENTKWEGVVIKSDVGTKVKSVAYGRIAFSDWLRGYGMLIIIDHQDGYMTLYGFNESINTEVGDWVSAGQEIATVGNSGTLATPALYFEIRKNAQPLNPKKWLK